MKASHFPFNQYTSGTGRPIQLIKIMDKVCLTSDQAKYIHKKGQKDSFINVGTIKQEIKEDRSDKEYDSEKENMYQSTIVNDFQKNIFADFSFCLLNIQICTTDIY